MRPAARGRAVLALAVAGLLPLSACQRANGEERRAPGAGQNAVRDDPEAHLRKEWAGPALPRGHVVLQDAYGGTHRVQVEIAATAKTRQRGMMWRTELAPGDGMLFVFPTEDEHSFWMRNTLIPLDMIFLAGDGTVVGVVHRAEPRSLVSRTVGRPSRYVLEVPGGWAQAKAIRTGARAELKLPMGLEVEDE